MSSSRHQRMNEGDWICPDEKCANLNFARRLECNRCGTEKPFERRPKKGAAEIGKAAAEKSRGLFSADDWMCPKCGNVNWARRSTCNVCNAPKTGDEERTGLGGGYNERENVEYIEREESDGEYDEFGRKKKKYRKPDDVGTSSTKVEVSKKKEEKVEDDEEEEDDEDDDEEGDLSKYDLWGDDDDEEKETEKKDEKKEDGKKAGDQKKEAAKESRGSDAKDSKDRERDRRRRSSSSSSDGDRRYRDRKERGRERRRSRSRSRSRSRDRRRR